MKKILSTIFIVLTLTIGIGGSFAVPNVAHAACNIGSVSTGNGLTDCIAEAVILSVMPIIGKFLQLTAYLFDQALVLNMNIAKYVQSDSTGLISPVEIVWRMIRDISGMFFIFVLIWASIKMILSGEASKGVIVGIVIAGLTVNFSLFLTKLVIDASNAMTLTIYTAIAPTAKPSFFGNASTDINGQVEGGVSSKIMEVVNLQSLFAGTQKAITTNFNVSSIVVMVGGISLMLVLGIAFLAAGVMFLWRFVMLLALMAFSPLPALAYAFPDFSKYGKQFTEKLVAQCVFAPIFLFFIYIALKVLTNPSFIALSGSKNSTFANVFLGGGIAPLIQYGLVIFIIFSGLGAASKYGAKGGEFGVEWMKGLGKWGQGAIKSIPAFAGQHTVGRAAKMMSDSEGFKDFAAKNPNLAVLSTQALKKVSGATFGGSKGGYDDRFKKYSKERTEVAKNLGFDKKTVDAIKNDFIAKDKKRHEEINTEVARNDDYLKRLQIAVDADPEGKGQESRNAQREIKEIREKNAKYLEEKKKMIDDYKKNFEKTEKDAKNARAKKFADSLKDGWNPITMGADEDAADTIEKSFKKDKKEELFEKFAKVVNEENKPDEKPSEDKPKKT